MLFRSVDKRFIPLTENDKLEEGDLVFFKIDQTKIVSHVGIYLKNSRFFSVSGINLLSTYISPEVLGKSSS